MIKARMMGGLGNQMFEYACARNLAHKRETSLELDTAWFASPDCMRQRRTFDLHCFNNGFSVATSGASGLRATSSKTSTASVSDEAHAGRIPVSGLIQYNEKHFHFDPAVLELPDNVYLNGYWQSELYFKENSEIIRQDFTFPPLPPGAAEMKERINGTNSVSVHVRRGDFLLEQNKRKHGLCSLKYYYQGMARFSDIQSDACFFIFTDDPQAVRENLILPFKTIFVDVPGNSAWDDMNLISECKNHIIANSTFSWWGAWLSRNPDKTVVAPGRFFITDTLDDKDLLPVEWVRI